MREFKGFQKGVNFGGWLSQCMPAKSHYDSFITEEDFRTCAEWGLDHVRIPVDFILLTDETGSVYKEEGFAYLDKAVEWARKYSLNVIIDLHNTPGFAFWLPPEKVTLFTDENTQEKFYSLWEQIAQRFADKSGTEGKCNIAFELLNEVTDKSYSKPWNEVAEKCIERIRKIAPETWILVGSYWNNSIESLPDLDMPYDEKIVYNFHCYEPFLFTHQAARWVKMFPQDYKLKYPFTKKEYSDEGAKLRYPLQEMFSNFKDEEILDVKLFEKIFSDAVKLAEERNVPLYCGEYGVIENAELHSSLNWYAEINRAFENHKIGRAAWSYKKMNFGVCDSKYEGHFYEIKF